MNIYVPICTYLIYKILSAQACRVTARVIAKKSVSSFTQYLGTLLKIIEQKHNKVLYNLRIIYIHNLSLYLKISELTHKNMM